MEAITDITSQLKRDEGMRLVPYKDTMGKVTVGWGHNLTDDGGALEPITIKQAEVFLAADIAHATAELTKNLPWSTAQATVYFGVLQNLCFNLGIGTSGKTGLLSFTHTLEAIRTKNYDVAASGLLQSKWAAEVGDRATRLSTQLRTGKWV